MDEAVKKIMDILGCTEQEAQDVIATDKKIDKGEKLFPLNPEEEKASKKQDAHRPFTTSTLQRGRRLKI